MSDTFDMLFSDPFLEGLTDTGIGPPYYMPVAINSHPYLVDLREYRRRTLPALRDPIDQGNEPGEQSLNTQGLWHRGQSDWRWGTGQTYFDDEGASRRRFYTSKGIDPWDEKMAKLLPGTELKFGSASSNLDLISVNGFAYLADGANLRYFTDLTPASPTPTSMAAAGTILGMTTDGSYVYVATGPHALGRTQLGAGSLSAFGAFQADVVGYANGRLLAADGNNLVELDSVGAVGALDYDHVNTNFTWQGFMATPNGIYAWGKAGDIAEIYFIDINEETGALKTPLYSGFVPYGETINDMAYYGGAVLIGTTKGLRVALAQSSTYLNSGPLIPIDGGVNGFDPRGQYVYFTWTNLDDESTGIGRVDLDVFTEGELIPAYASDLMATAQGTSTAVITFGDLRYFTIAGSGLWGQTDELVESGWFRTGKIAYGTFVNKVAATLDLKTLALPDGAGVQISMASDDGVFEEAELFSTDGALAPDGFISLPANSGEEMEFEFELLRGTDPTEGPTLKRWTVQSLAVPSRTDEFIVPLIVKDKVETQVGGGQPHSYQTLDEFLYLKSLEATGNLITYTEGARTYQLYLDAVEVQPDKWNDKKSFFNGNIVVRMLTVRPTN